MSKQRKYILIAAAAGLISMFLPWLSITAFGYSKTQNGMDGAGGFVFICFAACLAVSFVGSQKQNLDKTFSTITFFAGGLASFIVIWNIIFATWGISRFKGISEKIVIWNGILDSGGGNAGSILGYGIYCAAGAGVAVTLAAFMFRSPTDTIKGGFDNLKHDIENKVKDNSGGGTGTGTGS